MDFGQAWYILSQILLRTKYVPSVIRIHWRMLILECSQGKHYPVNTRINILQWILTKLGTYLVIRRVWNPIDFQGHRSKDKVTGSNFYLVIPPQTLFAGGCNKGNAKRGISPRLKIWPSDLDIWPWKSIGFQILWRTKYVPSLVKIHWRMLILECSQGKN
jgi:hypothetical protein